MTHADEVVAAAAVLLALPVEAAAVFGLADAPAAVIAGAVAGSAAGSAAADAVGAGGALLDGAAAAAGIHAAREVRAESMGLEVRMVLAVTAQDYHLLDWTAGRCTRELARFPREATHVQISRFGLSRRVRLDDPTSGAAVELTGSVSPISSESRADKGVLALLAGDAA